MSDETENRMRTQVFSRKQKPKVPSAWRVLAVTVLKDAATQRERRDRIEAARALARLVLEDDDV